MAGENKNTNNGAGTAASNGGEGSKTTGNNGKLKEAAKPEEGEVKLKEEMWIKGTGASKHLPKGTVHKVHPVAGAKLISKGAAEETIAPKAKPAPKKADNKKGDEDDE